MFQRIALKRPGVETAESFCNVKMENLMGQSHVPWSPDDTLVIEKNTTSSPTGEFGTRCGGRNGR